MHGILNTKKDRARHKEIATRLQRAGLAIQIASLEYERLDFTEGACIRNIEALQTELEAARNEMVKFLRDRV